MVSSLLSSSFCVLIVVFFFMLLIAFMRLYVYNTMKLFALKLQNRSNILQIDAKHILLWIGCPDTGTVILGHNNGV